MYIFSLCARAVSKSHHERLEVAFCCDMHTSGGGGVGRRTVRPYRPRVVDRFVCDVGPDVPGRGRPVVIIAIVITRAAAPEKRQGEVVGRGRTEGGAGSTGRGDCVRY